MTDEQQAVIERLILAANAFLDRRIMPRALEDQIVELEEAISDTEDMLLEAGG